MARIAGKVTFLDADSQTGTILDEDDKYRAISAHMLGSIYATLQVENKIWFTLDEDGLVADLGLLNNPVPLD